VEQCGVWIFDVQASGRQAQEQAQGAQLLLPTAANDHTNVLLLLLPPHGIHMLQDNSFRWLLVDCHTQLLTIALWCRCC
jgi:hypothetical protein